MSLKKKIKRTIYFMQNYNLRKRLKNNNFTIISDNCWGGFMYQYLGIEYNTPFVGMFIFAPDYIKMLQNLRYYINCELKFVEESKFKDTLIKYGTEGTYPVGKLDDIEIHFLHYSNENEAMEKWNKRKKRVNWENIFIKFCDANLCDEKYIEEFNNLNYSKKICFTAKNYPHLNSVIWLNELSSQKSVKNEWKICKKYFDVVNWLNN